METYISDRLTPSEERYLAACVRSSEGLLRKMHRKHQASHKKQHLLDLQRRDEARKLAQTQITHVPPTN